MAGIPIGRGNWVIEISEDQFTATASGGTFGILRVFSAGHGNSVSQGTLNAGQLVPMTYAATITNDKRIDDVRMVFAGGNVKDLRSSRRLVRTPIAFPSPTPTAATCSIR